VAFFSLQHPLVYSEATVIDKETHSREEAAGKEAAAALVAAQPQCTDCNQSCLEGQHRQRCKRSTSAVDTLRLLIDSCLGTLPGTSLKLVQRWHYCCAGDPGPAGSFAGRDSCSAGGCSAAVHTPAAGAGRKNLTGRYAGTAPARGGPAAAGGLARRGGGRGRCVCCFWPLVDIAQGSLFADAAKLKHAWVARSSWWGCCGRSSLGLCHLPCPCKGFDLPS